MNWELIGKIGGEDVQVHPVHVSYQREGKTSDREVLRVRGEPERQHLITLVGHYESNQTQENNQLHWSTESSDWVRTSHRDRGGQTQVAVLAQGGDTLTVGQERTDRFAELSFVGKAYVVPAPEISEEGGSTVTFPIEPMTVEGRNHTEHSVADLDIPPGEVWKVKVTGTYTWDAWIGSSNYPSVMVGAMQSKPASASNTVEVEAYASEVARISLITNSSDEVTFEGTVEITPMKW